MEKQGIKGWLLVFVIWFILEVLSGILTPLRLWHQAHGPDAVANVAFDFVAAVWLIIALVLIFMRKRAGRTAVIVYEIFAIVAWVPLGYLLAESHRTQAVATIAVGVLKALVTLLYFLRSKRVSNTLTQ